MDKGTITFGDGPRNCYLVRKKREQLPSGMEQALPWKHEKKNVPVCMEQQHLPNKME